MFFAESILLLRNIQHSIYQRSTLNYIRDLKNKGVSKSPRGDLGVEQHVHVTSNETVRSMRLTTIC